MEPRPRARTQEDGDALLDALTQTCKDGELAYAQAASWAQDPDVKEALLRRLLQRSEFVADLRRAAALRRPPLRDLPAFGALHRAWVDAREAIGEGGDATLIGECLRREAAAERSYRFALKLVPDLPAATRAMIERQLAEIVAASAELEALAVKAMAS